MDVGDEYPTLDRREQIEAAAGALMATVGDEVEHAWIQAAQHGGPPDAIPALREFTLVMLQATMTHFVQSGLSVGQRTRLLRAVRVAGHRMDTNELVRTVRLVGLEALRRRLSGDLQLTRLEYLRLRSSAERVADSILDTVSEEAPDRADILKRLQSTGSDLR